MPKVSSKNQVTLHLGGEIPKALGEVGPDLLAKDPDIRTIEILAAK